MASSLRTSRLAVALRGSSTATFLAGAFGGRAHHLLFVTGRKEAGNFPIFTRLVDPPGIEPGSGYDLETPCTGVAVLSRPSLLQIRALSAGFVAQCALSGELRALRARLRYGQRLLG